MTREYDDIVAENDLLRKALKPVIECECDFDVYAWMGDQLDTEQRMSVNDVVSAVRAAQEIMKGESK